MTSGSLCPECLAEWQSEFTCQEAFHQMLFWESENPGFGDVHHLMVLCYHLQHPSLYSPEGLMVGMRLLVDFQERGLTPEQARRRNASQVDSSRRNWKITGNRVSHGSYQHPIHWKMTAVDVVTRGVDDYIDNVQKWAQAVLLDLKDSGNLAGKVDTQAG